MKMLQIIRSRISLIKTGARSLYVNCKIKPCVLIKSNYCHECKRPKPDDSSSDITNIMHPLNPLNPISSLNIHNSGAIYVPQYSKSDSYDNSASLESSGSSSSDFSSGFDN